MYSATSRACGRPSSQAASQGAWRKSPKINLQSRAALPAAPVPLPAAVSFQIVNVCLLMDYASTCCPQPTRDRICKNTTTSREPCTHTPRAQESQSLWLLAVSAGCPCPEILVFSAARTVSSYSVTVWPRSIRSNFDRASHLALSLRYSLTPLAIGLTHRLSLHSLMEHISIALTRQAPP